MPRRFWDYSKTRLASEGPDFKVDFALPGTIRRINNELARARAKFPHNTHLTHALTEELGELAKAQMQGRPQTEIDAEAIQVAALAIRIIEETDADFENLSEETKQP